MGKQPYIPLYVGDYLKDTRMLPLAVRGAWVDILLFMWDAPVRGEIIGTIQEIARMIGCDTSEAQFALDLLKQKNTADIILLPSGEWKISSRRMKRDAEISAIRSEVGKKGVEAKKKGKFAIPKGEAKREQNNDIDIENDNGIDINYLIVCEEKILDPMPTLEFYQAQLNGMAKENNNIAWKPLVPAWMAEHLGEEFESGLHVKNSFKRFYMNNKNGNLKVPVKQKTAREIYNEGKQ